MGMVMGNADSIISSQRFVPASKAFGWVRLEKPVMVAEKAEAAIKEDTTLSSSRIPFYPPDTLDNPRLYVSIFFLTRLYESIIIILFNASADWPDVSLPDG